ncbi:MAG: OmpP1/FadL family transporter [bacterium]
MRNSHSRCSVAARVIGCARLFGVAIAVLSFSVFGSEATAQTLPDLASEIPLPLLTGTDARPMGMGGAGLAISEDASAIYWNPAGLAQMRRIELSATMTHDRSEFTSELSGFSSNVSNRSTRFGNARFVYPFPTYRGSLVIAMGNDQFRNYDQDLEILTREGPAGQRLEYHDTISESGKLSGWGFALAAEASPRLYVGGALYIHDGNDDIAINQVTEDIDNANPDTLRLDDIIETQTEISGVSANFGILYRVNPNVRIGATARTKMALTLEGTQVFDDLTVLDNGTEIFSPLSEIAFEDKIDFPPSFGIGGAVATGGLTVALDGRYTDWSQIAFDQNPLGNRGLQSQYEDNVSISLGAEYLVGRSPFRVRAGFLHDPVPFRLRIPTTGRDVEVEVDRDRNFLTLGAGILIDTVLTVDVALQTGSFSRESSIYTEERDLTRVFVSSAFRF